MKLMVVTNDPVQGTELADHLKGLGHLVVRAWSAGEALLLTRSDSPTLAIVDGCHGHDPEALKLTGYLVERRVDVLWLGEVPDLPLEPSGALFAALAPPCDPESVGSAVGAFSQGRAGADTRSTLARLTLIPK